MNAQQAVQNCSSNPILAAAQRLLSERFPLDLWLDKRNRYGKKTIDRLKSDGNNAPTKPNQFAEYIAASVVLHCTDGWTFFSHTVDHLLNGDVETSVFMAYYAQLRAVMSFLASEGIGIFNTKHFWVENNGRFQSFNQNTHDAVRCVIEKWADYYPKSIRLLSLLRLENISFADWVIAAQLRLGSTAVTEFARDWLRAWSLDLNTLSKDHNIRNEASYRPHRIYQYPHYSELEDHLHHLIEVWKASEPVGSHRFNILDRHLLRNTLITTFRNRTGYYPHWQRYNSKYRFFIGTVIDNLGLSLDNNLVDFLSNPDPSLNHPILREAVKKGVNKEGGVNPLPIISRAYLLLRLASAATENLLLNSSIKKEDLFFWWNKFGNDIGLWIPGNAPDQMTDLWIDVKTSVDAIEDWYLNNIGLVSISKIRQELPYDSWQIQQFNRAGLWAIGL